MCRGMTFEILWPIVLWPDLRTDGRVTVNKTRMEGRLRSRCHAKKFGHYPIPISEGESHKI